MSLSHACFSVLSLPLNSVCLRVCGWLDAGSHSLSIYIYAAGDEHAGLWVKARILEANKKLLVFVPYEENNRALVSLVLWDNC